MRIALLSNVAVDVLAGMLREEADVWAPPGVGAWVETALCPPRALVEFEPDTIAVLLDRRFSSAAPLARLDDVLAALGAAFPRAVVLAPGLEALFADLGEAAYDARLWELAMQPWSLAALEMLRALLVPPKKVLALDLDGTLWKGVVSEDGVSGIEPDAAFQRQALALKERGVLLVALSKNDRADVEPVWSDSRMVLGPDDFAAMRIDWNDKPGNLAAVARELNLGVDSFVFVDDNPGNRAEMRAAPGAVAVPPFPPDLALYFPGRPATEEDRARAGRYAAEARRRDLSARLSYEDYLRSLGTACDVHPMAEGEIARVAQLAQRSNQFNVAPHRWTEDEIRRFARDASRLFLTLHVRDRFGELGLVAFVHVRAVGAEGEIVDWVMSCRAMNRRIEFLFEAEVERQLAVRGVRRLAATYRPTAKNGPAEGLFDALGFERRGESAEGRRYEKRLEAT